MARSPVEWRLSGALPAIVEAMAQEPGDARWVWMVSESLSARLIDDIGFHSPLRHGATAEIGYVLEPGAQGSDMRRKRSPRSSGGRSPRGV